MKAFRGFIAAALSAALLGGCAPAVLVGVGAAAGVTGVKYYEGSLTAIYHASFEETWEAAEKTLERRNVLVELRKRGIGSGRISGQDFRGRPVTLNLEYVSPEETQVVIRVGHLGDKDESMAFKDDIKMFLFK